MGFGLLFYILLGFRYTLNRGPRMLTPICYNPNNASAGREAGVATVAHNRLPAGMDLGFRVQSLG